MTAPILVMNKNKIHNKTRTTKNPLFKSGFFYALFSTGLSVITAHN